MSSSASFHSPERAPHPELHALLHLHLLVLVLRLILWCTENKALGVGLILGVPMGRGAALRNGWETRGWRGLKGSQGFVLI